MQTLILNFSFGAYYAAMALYAAGLFLKNKVLSALARAALILVAAGLTAYIAGRWIEAGRPPLSNMYESLVLFSWAVAVAVIFADLKYKIASIAPFGTLLGLLALGYASLLDKEIHPLLPALKSNWLTIHVLTCFVGYAAFSVAFAASAILIFKARKRSEKNDTENLDRISYNMIAFGFMFLTLGIITGAVWANSAWGTYWSWDPKETWSLITWFIYAIYMHVRLQKGWKGEKAAWLSVLGFLAVLFTYFGVNFLLSGLHSYA